MNRKELMHSEDAPYIFISYSHRDEAHLDEISAVLREKGVRFWFDNGLHSGDDWNLVIATQLEKSVACLLLLSHFSASSHYVKNELNFAINHRIPIYIIMLESFELPIDIEIMIGRIQTIDKKTGYEQKLFEALPSEVFNASDEQDEKIKTGVNHPIYQIVKELEKRQGTVFYLGKHKVLEYNVLILEELYVNISEDMLLTQARTVVNLYHSLFPKIYDIKVENNRMYVFQEYRGEIFLDKFLETNKMQESDITEWILDVIDAIDYLYSLNFGFRDFARGSLIVTNNKKLGFSRLQNMHYGIIKLQPENKKYYFEKEIEEISVLLYQLCTGNIPVLPFSIINDESFSRSFINKVNLILQKSTKENNVLRYNSFKEMASDLRCKRISISDLKFLHKRKEKLKEYENIKKANLNERFSGYDENAVIRESLEEKFGFDSTVTMLDDSSQLFKQSPTNSIIKIYICSTRQTMEFNKDAITIGRGTECDMVLNQPVVSRRHVVVKRHSNDEYAVLDCNSVNGIFVTSLNKRIPSGEQMIVKKGEIIQIGEIQLQLC